MGDYSELVMACCLKKGISMEDIKILNYMMENTDLYLGTLPSHPLFRTERWQNMLRSDSYYFDGKTYSEIYFDEISKRYYITIRCNFKNYNQEIAKFLDWISAKSYSEGYVGYTINEYRVDPQLIYFYNGEVEYKEVEYKEMKI